MSGSRKYFHDEPDPPPFIKALAEVRRIGVHEGWCYQHVQAIIVVANRIRPDTQTAQHRRQPKIQTHKAHQETEGDVGRTVIFR